MISNSSSQQFDNVMRKLQAHDPQVRKQAIQWLARSKRREAVVALKKVSLTDPDEDVKRLAKKAVRYLTDQTQTMPKVKGATALLAAAERRTQEITAVPLEARRETRSSYTVPQDATEPQRKTASVPRVWGADQQPVEGRYIDDVLGGFRHYKLSDERDSQDKHERKEMARILCENAYNDHVHHQFLTALSKLHEALVLYPAIKHEPDAKRTIEKLMNMPMKPAVAILLDDNKREHYFGRRRKQLDGARMFNTWLHVGGDLLAFAAVVTVGLSAFLLALQTRSNALIAALAQNRDYGFQVRTSGDPAAAYQQIAQVLAGSTTTSLVIYALSIALLATVLLFIASMVTHAVASYMMRGTATAQETETNFIPTMMTFAGITLLLGFVTVYLAYPQAYAHVQNGVSSTLPILALASIAGGFLFAVNWQARLIALAHGLNRVMGYVSVLAGLLVASGLGYLAYLMIPALSL